MTRRLFSIGSTEGYGIKGVWRRWSEYAKTGHGGNVKLRELPAKKKDAARGLRFTFL